MGKIISELPDMESLSRDELATLLLSEGEEKELLFRKAFEVKQASTGNSIWLRGLIEFSNKCNKNCCYCGIRKDNHGVERYDLTDGEIIEAVRFAMDERYGSVVLQSGEIESHGFTRRITGLLQKIRRISGGDLGITLSLGEQEERVYDEWRRAGAHRYLLRIETSSPELYSQLHPPDGKHIFSRRIECLRALRRSGYQTGTGVMVGLPHQTVRDLASDLLFMKDMDIDMVGMGPYIEHMGTPTASEGSHAIPVEARLDLTLKMIAIMRIMMKDINIAASTALQAIDPGGRAKALSVGANVYMPNITPLVYRDKYLLYDNKPSCDPRSGDELRILGEQLSHSGSVIGYGHRGDSGHFNARTASQYGRSE